MHNNIALFHFKRWKVEIILTVSEHNSAKHIHISTDLKQLVSIVNLSRMQMKDVGPNIPQLKPSLGKTLAPQWQLHVYCSVMIGPLLDQLFPNRNPTIAPCWYVMIIWENKLTCLSIRTIFINTVVSNIKCIPIHGMSLLLPPDWLSSTTYVSPLLPQAPAKQNHLFPMSFCIPVGALHSFWK